MDGEWRLGVEEFRKRTTHENNDIPYFPSLLFYSLDITKVLAFN